MFSCRSAGPRGRIRRFSSFRCCGSKTCKNLVRVRSTRGRIRALTSFRSRWLKKAQKSAKKRKRAQKGARKGCSSLPGAASALEEAVRACFGAASALEEAVRACFGAASAFEKAVRVCCSRSLFESAVLGYTVLCASLLSSPAPCTDMGYARVRTSYIYGWESFNS